MFAIVVTFNWPFLQLQLYFKVLDGKESYYFSGLLQEVMLHIYCLPLLWVRWDTVICGGRQDFNIDT